MLYSYLAQLIPYLMEQHAKGMYPLEKIISSYDMREYAKAISDMEEGKTIKAVLKWA